MTLREKINEQFNTALRSKDKNLVSTFRLILAAIKEYDIKKKTEYFITSGKGKKEQATDQQIIKVLFLLFKAALNCSFIFFRNVMI